MSRKPTFELLRERRELRVINLENGVRFTISLRDWERCLWFVRVIPKRRRASDAANAYVRNHCMMFRSAIEEWLKWLRLT
jgi:hypothetical protein